MSAPMSRSALITAFLLLLALPGVAAAHADAGARAEAPFVTSDDPFDDAELAMLGEVAALDPFGLLDAPELTLADEPATPHEIALAETDLDSERGGFLTPLGLDIGFGAVVRTTVDGVLALESRLTWDTKGGAQEPVVTAGQPTAPDDLLAAAAAGGIQLDPDAKGWNGVVLPGSNGATAVLQQLNSNGISNLTINTADNRVIEQTTDINLNIPGLEAFQAQAGLSRMVGDLQQALDLELAN